MKYILIILLIIAFFLFFKKKEFFTKKALIIFYGYTRTIQKTYENIYENLINNNKNYEFTIIVNTSTEYKDNLWKCKNKKEIEEEIKKCYNVKNIFFEDYNDGTYDLKQIGNKYPYRRFIKPLENEINNNYDIMIGLRFDIVLNNKIILDDYHNNFCIVTGNFIRGGDCFHNKDWDYMFIGCPKAFKLFFYNIIKHYFNITIKDNYEHPIIDIISSIEDIKYKNVVNKLNLKGEWNELLYEHSLLSYMIENKIDIILSDTQNIEATIIR